MFSLPVAVAVILWYIAASVIYCPTTVTVLKEIGEADGPQLRQDPCRQTPPSTLPSIR